MAFPQVYCVHIGYSTPHKSQQQTRQQSLQNGLFHEAQYQIPTGNNNTSPPNCSKQITWVRPSFPGITKESPRSQKRNTPLPSCASHCTPCTATCIEGLAGCILLRISQITEPLALCCGAPCGQAEGHRGAGAVRRGCVGVWTCGRVDAIRRSLRR